MNRRTQNSVVMLAAVGAALVVVKTQTQWVSNEETSSERERCYGVVKEAKNDCATTKHSCAAQAIKDRAPEEWIMVPKGLCEKLAGGTTEVL